MPFNPQVEKAVELYASKWEIPLGVAKALVMQESSGNPKATSKDKQGRPLAKGLTQLTDLISKQYGVKDPYDVDQNLNAGFAYLSNLKKQYGGDLESALAHYNGGPGAVKYFKNKGGIFHDPSMDSSTWANQTGGYVKKIMAASGGDTSHIPVGRRDQILAMRKAADTGGGPETIPSTLIADISKKKVPLASDTGGGITAPQPIAQQQQMALPAMFSRLGAQSPVEVLANVPSQAANLLFQPALAQEQRDIFSEVPDPGETTIPSGNKPLPSNIQQNQQQDIFADVPDPEENIQTISKPEIAFPPNIPSISQEPGLVPGLPIAEKAVRGVAKLPNILYGAASVLGNEFIRSDATMATFRPFDLEKAISFTGLSEEKVRKKAPIQSFIGDIIEDIPTFGVTGAVGGALGVGLLATGAGPITAGVGVLGAAAGTGFLLNAFEQLGSVIKKEEEVRQRRIQEAVLPGGGIKKEELASLPPIGGFESFVKGVNPVEAAVTGAAAGLGELAPGVKATIKGVGAGIKGLKESPTVLKGIIQFPQTVYETFINQLNSNYLSEIEKIQMFNFINAFNEKLAGVRTVGDTQQIIKSVLRKENKFLKDAEGSLSPSRAFSKEQLKVITQLKSGFKKAYEELISQYERNKMITKEQLKGLEEKVLQTQQELMLNASKFGLSRDAVRSSIKQIRVSSQKIAALLNIQTKLRIFNPTKPLGEALFVATEAEKRVVKAGIKGRTKAGKEELFRSSQERLTGKIATDKAAEIGAKAEQIKILESRVKTLQFTIDDELTNNPPVGKTREEFNVIMPDLKDLANDIGVKFEKMTPNEIKKSTVLLNKLEEKLEKKGVQLTNLENEFTQFSEEINSLTSAIAEKTQQAWDPPRFSKNVQEDIYTAKDILEEARQLKEPNTIDRFFNNVRTGIYKQLTHVQDGLKYLDITGERGADKILALTKEFDNTMHVGKVLRGRVSSLMDKANIKPRTQISKALARIQRTIGSDEILKINTENEVQFAKDLSGFVNKFKERIPLLNDPAVQKQLNLQRVRALQEVVQKYNPMFARIGNFDIFGIQDPYFFEQAGAIKSTTLSDKIVDQLRSAFGLKRTNTIQTDILKQYTLKKQGFIKEEDLVEDFVIGNTARVDTAFFKDSVESLYSSFTKLLEGKEVSEDVTALMHSIATQLTGKNLPVGSRFGSELLNNLDRTRASLLGVVSGGLLNTPSFATQDLTQVFNTIGRLIDKPKAFYSTAKAFLNPKEQKEVISGLVNLGIFEGSASRDVLSRFAAGEQDEIYAGLTGVFNELGQAMNKRIDGFAEIIGKISRQDPESLSFGLKRAIDIFGDNPLINIPETILKTLTASISLFDKYGDDTLNVLRSINTLAAKESSFTRRGIAAAEKVVEKGVPLKPSEANLSVPLGETLKGKLTKVFQETQQVVNDSLENDLFIRSEFSSLLSSESGILRFSTFAFRQASYGIRLLLEKPENYARYLHLQLLAGGSQTLIPYARNVNQINRLLGGQDIFTEEQYARADEKLRAGEIPGARILGLFNNATDLGIGNKIVPDVFGFFPIEVAALEQGQRVVEQAQKSSSFGDYITNNALEIAPWLSAVIHAGTGLKLPGFLTARIAKTFLGNPLATNEEKRKPRLNQNILTVASSDGRYMEEVNVNDFSTKFQLSFGIGKDNLFLRRFVGAKGLVKDNIRAEVRDLSEYIVAYVDKQSSWKRKELFENFVSTRHNRLLEQEDFKDTFSRGSKYSKDLFSKKQDLTFDKFRAEQFDQAKGKLTNRIEDIAAKLKYETDPNLSSRLRSEARRAIAIREALTVLSGSKTSPQESTERVLENIEGRLNEGVVF